MKWGWEGGGVCMGGWLGSFVGEWCGLNRLGW